MFCNSITEIHHLLTSLSAMQWSPFVRGYYSGLPAASKAKIVEEFKKGWVRILLTTNALEAGVDIAEVDACLLYGKPASVQNLIVEGYPGSRMSFWQRIGRAGRTAPGLVVFVPDMSNPMDLYFSRHPDALLGNHMENISFEPNGTEILRKHLLCAAYESGIDEQKAAKYRY